MYFNVLSNLRFFFLGYYIQLNKVFILPLFFSKIGYKHNRLYIQRWPTMQIYIIYIVLFFNYVILVYPWEILLTSNTYLKFHMWKILMKNRQKIFRQTIWNDYCILWKYNYIGIYQIPTCFKYKYLTTKSCSLSGVMRIYVLFFFIWSIRKHTVQ